MACKDTHFSLVFAPIPYIYFKKAIFRVEIGVKISTLTIKTAIIFTTLIRGFSVLKKIIILHHLFGPIGSTFRTEKG